MKNYKTTLLLLVMGAIVVSCSCNTNPAYSTFCNTIAEKSGDNPDWRLAIYLDVRACLSCCENMETWKELEEKLPQCGCAFSLWASREDSMDVAIALKLEGLKTPVQVISDETIKALKWNYPGMLVKVLFNNQCKPVEVLGPSTGHIDSKHVLEKLLARVCGEENRAGQE